MNRLFAFCSRVMNDVFVAIVLASGCLQTGHSEEVVLDEQTFTLPDGFTIEMAAGPDLVPRPIVADFDSLGDLYVADSSGTNDDVQTQLDLKPHRILRLRDTDGDGRFDQSLVFADQMMFPEGVLCYRGSVFVAAPPHIWRLTDDDHDGKADRREVWLDAKTLTGCANDLHGPYLGRDGWIYWCKGAFAEQTYERSGGESWSTRAAHVFRRRLEGGDIEAVMTGGMDNPVEMITTPEGERIFTTTFLQHPSGGRRDGLIHAVYGGVYGKQHGVLDGHPRTGELMPVLSHLGPAAPSGLMQLETTAWPDAYHGNLFSAAFNLHQVTRHQLRRNGASFTSDDTAWLVSDNLDFHPTDVLEDADGSVLVVDTGGWYKLCCPTSQLHKPDVLGAIYRVRNQSTRPINDPRGREIAWKHVDRQQLLERLADARPAVRRQAVERLAELGENDWEDIVDAWAERADAQVRLQLVWAASRAKINRTRLLQASCTDADPRVRTASLHVISVHREQALAAEVVRALNDDHPAVRRAAAEAAGRLGERAAIPELVRQAGRDNDRVLEHALTYALFEIGAPQKLTKALTEAHEPRARIALLIALDQLPSTVADFDAVLRLTVDSDPRTRQLAMWLAQRRPERAESMLEFFVAMLGSSREEMGEEQLQAMNQLLPSVLAEPDRQSRFLASLQPRLANQQELPSLFLRFLKQAAPRVLSPPVQEQLAVWLKSGNSDWVREVVETLADLRLEQVDAKLRDALVSLASDTAIATQTRLLSLVACGTSAPQISDECYALILEAAENPHDVGLRNAAVRSLTAQSLSDVRKQQVLEILPRLGPVELRQVLAVFQKDQDPELGQRLVDVLAEAPAQAVIPREDLDSVFRAFGEAIQQQARTHLSRPTAGRKDQVTRLEELFSTLPPGDVRRGQAVFHSAKAACFGCHEMGYRGGEVGPDLTRIGQIRSRRDLLEAIVFPSASFVRNYEPMRITTTRGVTINGVVRDQTATEVVLFDEQRQERRVRLAEVESMEPSAVSVMPSGIDQLLSPQELSDVVTFLEAAR
jgi:putative membrane-bound dehydrogenase-like protein